MQTIVASYVCASSHGQRMHSARINIIIHKSLYHKWWRDMTPRENMPRVNMPRTNMPQFMNDDIDPSGVHALPVAAGTNTSGHYCWHFLSSFFSLLRPLLFYQKEGS